MSDERPDDDVQAMRRALLAALPALALMDSASAQDAAKVQPQAYRVALDNDKVRVLEYNSRPGMGVCGTGMHSHPPHLTVTLTSAKLHLRTPDGKARDVEMPQGTVFWSEAETHETENIAGANIRCLLIELKPAKV